MTLQVATPTTLLGQLQRGRGLGSLHAVMAARADVHHALLACLTHDPRWDRDLESRADYYARLMLHTRMDVERVARHLGTIDLDAGKRGDANLAVDVLGILAGAGDEGAATVLRDQVACGGAWEHALRALAWEDPKLTEGLDDVLARRFPGDAIYGAMSDYEPGFDGEPWTTWRGSSRWVAGLHQWQEHTPALAGLGPRPSERMSAIDLLECAERGWRGEAGSILGRRNDPSDVPLLVAVAREGAGGPAFAALRALGMRRNPAALEAAIARVKADNGAEPLAMLTRYITAFPETATLRSARDWFASDHRSTRLLGERILARYAESRDLPALRGALRDAQAASDVRREGAVLDALAHLSDDGPYPEVAASFTDTPSSMNRQRAAYVLAASDSSFARGLAVECLWDSEPGTRELACAHVDIGAATVLARLHEMADDAGEDDGVREASEERLG